MYNLEALKKPIFKIISDCSESLNVASYVVGGYVRDIILSGKKSNDIDIVAIGDGIELAKAVSNALPNKPKVSVYKTYGTAMICHNNIDLEFVGARRESYQKNSRNPKVFTGSIEDDQKRRDFTINALAISLNKVDYGKILDPFDGIKDLNRKRIITPLDPNITFSDDPLRMLRAIRFASQLNFKVDDNCIDAIKKNSNRIKIITKERIVVELNKILESTKPSIGFKLLEKTNLLDLILPELTALKGVDEIEGQSHKDNFYHTLEVVDNISIKTNNVWLRWTALLHDIGKAPTKKFSDKVGWTFHGHELKGSKMVYQIFKRLKMPLNDKMKYVQKLVFLSSRPIAISGNNITDAAVRRLVYDAGENIDDLITLCEADITTKNPKKFKLYHNNFKIVRKKMVEVEERDRIRNFQPPISGEEIMNVFELKPCREIGIIKEFIKEAILDGDIPNNKKAAYDLMVKKGTQLGLKSTI
ncbi:MAG: CCA tRNA nucleotidyltransferase [Flavobacteriaceae bacterium]